MIEKLGSMGRQLINKIASSVYCFLFFWASSATYGSVVSTTPSVSFNFSADSIQTINLNAYPNFDLIESIEANWTISLSGRVAKITKVGGGSDSATLQYKQNVGLQSSTGPIGTGFTHFTPFDTGIVSGSILLDIPDVTFNLVTQFNLDGSIFFYGSGEVQLDLLSTYAIEGTGPFLRSIEDPGIISGEVSLSYITDPTQSILIDPPSPIPIPPTILLFGSAIFALIGYKMRARSVSTESKVAVPSERAK